ncbi:Tim18 protein [Martiniozyma asiatica (nom. inval.)]|nr:Tim18 protein [Martiniozyma asiatica]
MIASFRPALRQSLLRPQFQTRSLRLIPRLPKLPSFKIKEDVPGNIVGTVNDPYIHPPYAPEGGSFHWAYERIITVAMTPLVATPFIMGVDYPMLDAGLGLLILLHSRYGLQSCVIDYIPLRKFQFWHKFAMFLLNIGTCVSMYGVYVIETEENGLCDLIARVWKA